MGINKHIVQSDDIETNYHRIIKLEILVNNYNYIEIASYVNYEARQKQIQNENKENAVFVPYMVFHAYTLPYDETMSIEGAYNALKQFPDFEGATDVLEEGQVLRGFKSWRTITNNNL